MLSGRFVLWALKGAALWLGPTWRRGGQTVEVFADEETLQPAFEEQIVVFQVKKARRGYEQQAQGESWARGLRFSALVLTQDPPLVSSHLQLLFKHEDLKTRNGFWKHCCLLIGAINYHREKRAAVCSLGCVPESPRFVFGFVPIQISWPRPSCSLTQTGLLKLVRSAFTNLEVDVVSHHGWLVSSSPKTAHVL